MLNDCYENNTESAEKGSSLLSGMPSTLLLYVESKAKHLF